MSLNEQYDLLLAGVERATGHRLAEKKTAEPPKEGRGFYRFHKLTIGGCEFATEFDGLSIHAFSEDFSTGAKDARLLGQDGLGLERMVEFLADGIAAASAAPGPR